MNQRTLSTGLETALGRVYLVGGAAALAYLAYQAWTLFSAFTV